MGISLDTEKTSYPAIKFENKGDFVQIACIRVETIPMTVMGTQDPIIGKDGKARVQSRITGFVVDSKAKIKDADEMVIPAPGTIVSLYIKGLSRWEFFQAKTKMKPDTFEVGDLLTWRFTGTQPGQVAGTTKKLYTVEMGKPEDPDMLAACEDMYHKLTGMPASGEEIPPYDPSDEEMD